MAGTKGLESATSALTDATLTHRVAVMAEWRLFPSCRYGRHGLCWHLLRDWLLVGNYGFRPRQYPLELFRNSPDMRLVEHVSVFAWHVMNFQSTTRKGAPAERRVLTCAQKLHT